MCWRISKEKSVRWALWSLVIGGAAGWLGSAFGLLGRAGTTEWPPITDLAALRREAAALCRDAGGWRELQPANYPPAMTRLHPASISISGERVYVALVPTPGGRTRYHGYFIWPDGRITREESNGAPSGL